MFFEIRTDGYVWNQIIEESNYYPFGLKHKGYNANNLQPSYKYKYNGKELQEELGLNMYDYGARNYDPALGRWMNIDPKAETSRRFSPYTYALNNPVYFIDPDGMEATSDFKDKAGKLVAHINDGSNAVFQQTGSGTDLHYEKTGYEQQEAGSVDSVTPQAVTSAVQEQQTLNNDNPALQADSNGTHCNQATQNIMKTVGSAEKDSNAVVSGNANSMIISLNKEQNKSYQKVDQKKAEENAENGGLSVIGYFNSNPKEHGHVLTYSVGDNIEKGKVANIGPKKYTGFISLNGSISKNKTKSYYIYVPK